MVHWNLNEQWLRNYHFVIQWRIKETELMKIQTSNTFGYLRSKRFNISSDSDIKYYLKIFPNGTEDENRGEASIIFHLEFGKKKKIQAFLNYSIESAQYSCYSNALYERRFGWGICSSSTEELFDSNKRFFVDEEMILKVEGFLLIEMGKAPNTVLIIKKGIASKRMKFERNKNFTIKIDLPQILPIGKTNTEKTMLPFGFAQKNFLR